MAVDVAALVAWLEIPTTPALSTDKVANLQRAIDAATAKLNGRCNLPSAWTDDVELACLTQAARFYRRKSSPEGVAGFGEFGGIRVSRLDPDIEALVSDYLKVEFA